MLLLLYCFLFIWIIVITSYFKLDSILSIFDHMNGSLFDELILIKNWTYLPIYYLKQL